MKKKDAVFIACLVVMFSPFFLSGDLFASYKAFNRDHGLIMSFLKFALLATTGEVIGLRIKEGVYTRAGFGLLPRAVVWGFLGLAIKAAFVIFAKGTPVFLGYLGLSGFAGAMAGGLSVTKVIVAMGISIAMNTIFAPVLMTLHKVTDIHIENNGGTLSGLLKPIRFGEILSSMDWNVQWNFVFKKTIPFFWIPAHTVTFLLPSDYQVLFAALLGIVLGLLLAVAGLKSGPRDKKEAGEIAMPGIKISTSVQN